MPTYRITGPDGKAFDVTAPDGASQDEVLAYAQKNFKMAAAPKAEAPAKPFGQQLNEVLGNIPRAAGVTARGALQGIGAAADFIASPIRERINASLREGQLLEDVLKGRVKPSENVARISAGLPVQQTLSGLITGQRIPGATQAPQIGTGSGRVASDLLGLPNPETPYERIASGASELTSQALLPIGVGRALSQASSPVVSGVGRLLASNPGQQLASAAAAGGAGGYTRETGGNEGAQLAASLAAGVGTPFAIGGAQRAAGAARQAIAPRPAPVQQIDITINNALRDSGLKLGDLPADVARSIRDDVGQALNVSPNLSETAVRRLADYRLTGLTPTRANLTLNPAEVTRQRNLAKLGANSRDPAAQQLAEVQNLNNRTLTQNLNDLGAANAGDRVEAGQRIMTALSARNQAAKSSIDTAYQAARDTSGRAAALDPSVFTQRANDLLDDALLGGKLPGDVRNLLNRTAKGEMPLTVDVAEQFKTRIGDLQRSSADGAERKALGLVRDALEDTPLLPGQDIGQSSIDAFNRARQLNRQWAKTVDRTPALQAVRDGIEPDKFVQQYITGSGTKSNIMDVAQLKAAIRDNPEALQSVKDQITAHLKSQATSGAADEVANFSQSAYNKALRGVGDQKLKLFFSPEEIARLKAIGRVASYEQVQPVGAAVNNSNTAGAVGGLLERIGGSSLLGKIPLGRAAIGDPLQNIVLSQQAGRALNAPQALIGAPGSMPRIGAPRQGVVLSPAALMGMESEEERQRRERGY